MRKGLSAMSSSLRQVLLVVCCCSSIGSALAGDVELPALGKQMSPQDIEAISTTVYPDGKGLPAGAGTAEQGKILYEEKCAVCHGETGAGDEKNTIPPLAGAPKKGSDWSTGASWPYAPAIFDYVRRAMPPRNLKQLSADETYALVAYILHMNDLIPLNQQLSRESLPAIRMPAAGYFNSKWKKSESRIKH